MPCRETRRIINTDCDNIHDSFIRSLWIHIDPLPRSLQRFSGSKNLGWHSTSFPSSRPPTHVSTECRCSVYVQNVSTKTTDEPARGLTKASLS